MSQGPAEEPDPEQQDTSGQDEQGGQAAGTETRVAPAAGGTAAQPMDDREAQNWSVAAHLSGLLWLVSVPGLIGPLVVWLLKGSEHERVMANAKEAVNFQLTLLIYGVIIVVLFVTIIGIIVAIPLALVAVLMAIVLPILAAVKTSEGQDYRYPFTFRLIA